MSLETETTEILKAWAKNAYPKHVNLLKIYQYVSDSGSEYQCLGYVHDFNVEQLKALAETKLFTWLDY